MPVAPLAAASRGHRLVALDWMRGLVMALMAFDHASEEVNAGRLFTDGTFLYVPGTPLPLGQFLARWVTHLCAPTFVFLAGASLAMSVGRRAGSGESAWSIDRHLLARGLFIAGCELWVSLFWMPPGTVLFQVLYAIGGSLVAMVLLRRLPTGAIVGLGAAIIALGEGVASALGWQASGAPLVGGLLLVPGRHAGLIVAYPVLPWLGIMLLGWGFGAAVARATDPRTVRRGTLCAGVGLLALFAVVRGVNAYGNAGLLREGASLAQWLHVSKYPPSVAFAALELGVMFLGLSALMVLAERVTANSEGVILVLGRTPMFFYLLHIPLLTLAGHALHVSHRLGIGASILFAAGAVAILYPACRAYGRYKATGEHPWTRFV